MTKADFVQTLVARVNDVARAADAIAHAEKLWAVLETAGYGAPAAAPAPRAPRQEAGTWDGLPPPKTDF